MPIVRLNCPKRQRKADATATSAQAPKEILGSIAVPQRRAPARTKVSPRKAAPPPAPRLPPEVYQPQPHGGKSPRVLARVLRPQPPDPQLCVERQGAVSLICIEPTLDELREQLAVARHPIHSGCSIVELAQSALPPLTRVTWLQSIERESRARLLLEQREPERPVLSAWPAPPPHAPTQRFERIDDLVERFYAVGLQPCAQHIGMCADVRDLMTLPLERLQIARMLHCYAEKQRQTLWRFLWNSCLEQLEWYLVRGAAHFGSVPEEEAARYGRSHESTQQCDQEARFELEEESLRDILRCFAICRERPSGCEPLGSQELEDEVRLYANVHLSDRLRFVEWRLSVMYGEEDPIEGDEVLGGALPACPSVHASLRHPQVDRLPPGWTWRRQVRGKFGSHFGLADTYFYPNWEDNFAKHGRYRSYREMERAQLK